MRPIRTVYLALGQLVEVILPLLACLSPRWLAWKRGQEALEEVLRPSGPISRQPCIWMHCASLGEWEIGKPVFLETSRCFPNHRLVLTFFSPSGFDAPRKLFPSSISIFPFPMDTPEKVSRWVNVVQPDTVFFVKQELWLLHLETLAQRQIPIFLIAGTISPCNLSFPFYGLFYRHMLRQFNQLFLQEDSDLILAESVGLAQALVTGNPRVDMVASYPNEPWHNLAMDRFFVPSQTIVFGSIWPSDLPFLRKVLSHPLYADWRVLVAPHDVSPAGLSPILDTLRAATSFSLLSRADSWVGESPRVLVLDEIGLLRYAYRYGVWAYVGGGFGKGIHNLLEPMAYGLPIVFGPRFRAFSEARFLAASGGGFPLHKKRDEESTLLLLAHAAERVKAGLIASSYITRHMGTIDRMMPLIREVLHSRVVSRESPG